MTAHSGLSPPLLALNLAKGEFLAKQSRSEAKIGTESARHADLNAHNGARDGRKVRAMGRLRSFDMLVAQTPTQERCN
jgi:hypothetical protein